MKKLKILSLLLVISALVLTACGRPSTDSGDSSDSNSDEKTYTIRLAYLPNEEQSTHLASVTFKETLESKSNGRLKVELYPSGSLYGSDREAIEAVQLNNIEMTIPALSGLSSFNKKFMVFDLPFLFKTNADAYKTLDSDIGQELLDDLSNNGMKGLAYGENGFRHLSNNEGPIESPADLKGLKFRTMENAVHTESFRKLGANASPFAFGELYTALQQGTYDAMESPISLYYTNKFFEVQDYLTISGHFYTPTILLMNNTFFTGLPEDLQKLVQEASLVFKDEQRKIAQEQDTEWLKELENNGMKINELTPEQIDVFRETLAPIYDQFKDEIGADIVDEVLKMNQ